MKPICLAILDVGHGNAAVLLDTGGVIVIDAGKGGIILEVLLDFVWVNFTVLEACK